MGDGKLIIRCLAIY